MIKNPIIIIKKKYCVLVGGDWESARDPEPEAIIPGTGSILHDGAEVSGKVKNFNQDPGRFGHFLENLWIIYG